MRRDARGVLTLEYPDDILGFTHAGVELVRVTHLKDLGHYRATVLATGREYRILGGGSKRRPWRIEPGVGAVSGLVRAAEEIARYDRFQAFPASARPGGVVHPLAGARAS